MFWQLIRCDIIHAAQCTPLNKAIIKSMYYASIVLIRIDNTQPLQNFPKKTMKKTLSYLETTPCIPAISPHPFFYSQEVPASSLQPSICFLWGRMPSHLSHPGGSTLSSLKLHGTVRFSGQVWPGCVTLAHLLYIISWSRLHVEHKGPDLSGCAPATL